MSARRLQPEEEGLELYGWYNYADFQSECMDVNSSGLFSGEARACKNLK